MLSAETLRTIRRIEIRTDRIVTEALGGQFRSAFKGRGMEFEEVRPYQIGDDVRTIDWNVSARAGEPFVKLFREERELTVLLAVDVSGSLAFGTEARLKRELCAEVAATLAFSAIRSNDKAGLLSFTDRIERFVPPRKGPRHVLRIVREVLAPAGHDGAGARPHRSTDLATALDEVGRLQKRKAVVFLVSDFLGADREPAIEGALLRVAARHDLIPIRIADRRERTLPKVGFVELEDLESGRRVLVDTTSAAVRDRYARLARERDERLAALFRRCGLEAIELSTGSDFVEPLVACFRRREARRGR